MEILKPIHPFSGRAALLAAACLIVPLHGGETRVGSSMAASEESRRRIAIEEAQELLRKGDEAYQAGRYDQAAEAYAGARELIPDAPISAALRDAATQRFSQASVEHARVLSRKGDVPGARAAVDKVLQDSMAPDDPDALAFRAELDDPIRTNPALTAEHAKNVDQVRRLLYTAQGAHDLGKFDQAISEYEEVLRIDPTNSAARRGMERTVTAKRGYYTAAADHTRAEMLSQVDAAWELQVPPPALDFELDQSGLGRLDADFIPVSNKIERIIIPRLAMDQVTLEEALDFLRVRAVENDTLEPDPARKGVNFTVNLGPPDSPESQKIRTHRFDLRLNQVPISQVLKYITEITQTSYTTDEFSVIITPSGFSSDALVARSYRVPPDFIGNLTSGAGAVAANDDPFAAAPAQGGLLATRVGAQEALAQQGVNFPEGASASYTPANNLLRVVNTAGAHDYISQIIDNINQTEPVMVVVRVTMIETEQTHLEELGFDWILDNFGFGDNSWVPGDKEFNLGGGTRGNGGDLSDIELPPGSTSANPITAGNRSGDGAISGNSIDDVLTNSGGRQSNQRAPGVFGVRGALDNANFSMLMRGLNQSKGTDVLARPSVTTRSGQASSITMVREFIYPTEYEPPEVPNDTTGGVRVFLNGVEITGNSAAVTPATPTAFETRDTGVSLEVLPIADPDKQYIDVTLSPEFVNFDGFVNYGSPINRIESGLLGPATIELTSNTILMPVFSTKSFSTNIRIADGATIVVGGLLQDRVQNVEDKTPILGSIPVIGRLFQSTARQPISTALIFLVNVELQDPTGRPYREN